jgi:transposase
MGRGRPTEPLELTESERSVLLHQTRQRTGPHQSVLRACIILGCADGRTNTAVAKELGICKQTAGKWRSRFLRDRLDGLQDAPRLGTPRSIDDEKIMEVVNKTLSTKPKNATHWSTRSMAKEAGLSADSIIRIWHVFGLQPHRVETFKLSTDPQFVEKVRDVVGLYLNPPDRALVLSVDEKSQIQALDRTQLAFPIRPGLPERQSHDYTRHGTTTLFAALNVKTGEVIGQCHQRHRQDEFIKFLDLIETQVPPELDVHLIVDNYATHKTERVKKWLLKHPRYQLHFTPTSASWLNMIERFFAEITNKRIRRGTFHSVAQLKKAITDYLEMHNENPKPFVWTKSANEILAKVKRFCERTSRAVH